ncbi:hypothetical protein [Methylobacterium oryzisoli]|uniref:hypothetical protein n=1 Tax=Methylobacterium oryzisoli TaxID=3385502 RepID=UPI003891F758
MPQESLWWRWERGAGLGPTATAPRLRLAAPAGPRPAVPARRLAAAFLPLAAALAALGLAGAAGLDQARVEAVGLGGWFYGFFLDLYPLYAFALVYGLARVIAVTVEAMDRPVPLRLVGAGIGLAALLALSLHPTFGGLVLRGGFMVGGMTFLNGAPMPLARALGALAAALVFALPLGLAGLVGGRRLKPGWLGRGLLRLAALWWALGLLGLGRAVVAGWPARPLTGPEMLAAAGLLAAAFLPHALLAALPPRRAARAS